MLVWLKSGYYIFNSIRFNSVMDHSKRLSFILKEELISCFFDMKGMSLDIKDGGDKVNVFILHSDNQVIVMESFGFISCLQHFEGLLKLLKI